MFRTAVFITAVMPSACFANELESSAIALVTKLGGLASVDPKLDEIARIQVKLDKATDATLQQLAKTIVVGSILITDATACTEAGFAALKELPDLQILTLVKCQLTDKEAAAIGTIRALNELFLGESKLNDVSFVGLKKLVNLKKLDVMDAAITDKSAPVLLSMKKLEELNLSGTKFGDPGVEQLKGLTNLKLLRLNKTNATRKSIDILEAARGKELTVRW
jgi:Leucine-rich repeat (LRR) protein